MNKLLRILKISLIIILGGMLVPALLSIIFSGFRINLISIVNFEFVVGALIAMTGGVLVVTDFSKFKKRVMKTPIDMELENDEDENKINWSYLLFFTGAAIIVLAIFIGEI
jgi:hypothetical protein